MRGKNYLALVHRAQLIKNLLASVAPDNEIVGLEIGVWKGDLLQHLLEQMPRIKKLYGIDPWKPGSTTRSNLSAELLDDIYKRTISVFQVGQQVVLIRGKSQDVIDQVPNELHFVEIDGDHTYEQVCIDLRICEPKVRMGGLFCGHDYFGRKSAGVKKAVDEFAITKGKEVQSKEEDVGMWWWFK